MQKKKKKGREWVKIVYLLQYQILCTILMGKKESTYKNIIKVWRSKLVKNLNGKL